MTRAQRQTWSALAFAIVAHGAAVGYLMRVPIEHLHPATTSAWRASAAPLVVKHVEPVAPHEANALGEVSGSGESIARVDLPEVARSDRVEDFEQAWTRQKPMFAAPSEVALTTKAQATGEDGMGPRSFSGLVSLATSKRPEMDETGDATPRDVAPESTEASKDASDPSRAASTVTPDPAVAGPSDLDPFAKEEGITFSPGGIAAREGREVKLVRPRVELGFMAEATRLGGRETSVKVQIETDAAGKPRSVLLIESSGSDVIDDAVRLAIYDSWFGGRMPDAFAFRVTFR